MHQKPANAQLARNMGMQLARGDIFLLLDDDITADASLIEAHLRNYQNEGIDAVAGFILEPGMTGPTTELPATFLRKTTGWMHFPMNFGVRRDVISWPSCNSSVRRANALRIGGFDENFFKTIWDDSDFCWRLHCSGARIVHDPSAKIVHHKVPSGGARPSGRNEFVIADQHAWATYFYFWRKNFGMFKCLLPFYEKFRGTVFRKVNIIRTRYLFVALSEMIRGWVLASQRLRARTDCSGGAQSVELQIFEFCMTYDTEEVPIVYRFSQK